MLIIGLLTLNMNMKVFNRSLKNVEGCVITQILGDYWGLKAVF